MEAAADVETPGAGGFRPLYIAARHGRVEVLRALVEAGADVETPTAGGVRPLHKSRHNKGTWRCCEC
jgi:ankyrin repeat protein